MELLKVPAEKIKLGDVLGEGQVVCCITNVMKAPDIRVYWGPENTFFTSPHLFDHSEIYQKTDLVPVIRR